MFFRASQRELKNIGNFIPLRGAKNIFCGDFGKLMRKHAKVSHICNSANNNRLYEKAFCREKSLHFVSLQGEEETKTAFFAIAHRNVAMMKGYGIANYGKPET